MSELPPNYIEGITRVSSLVEHLYPFEWTEGEKRYKQWLAKKGIDEREYIAEACNVGTFIHLQMEHRVLGSPLDVADSLFQKHQNEIVNWLTFMEEYWLTDMQTEVYCKDSANRYQGSIDLLATINEGGADKRILVDWKTWWIAKKRWDLPNKTTKPYDKLKKVALQMSLYAKALWNIDEIWVVWLHDEGAFVYKLELVPNEELEMLIMSHQTKNLKLAPDAHLTINYNPMEIKVQTTIPGEAYSVACVTMEAADMDNAKTIEENIWYVIKLQKTLVGKYKEGGN